MLKGVCSGNDVPLGPFYIPQPHWLQQGGHASMIPSYFASSIDILIFSQRLETLKAMRGVFREEIRQHKEEIDYNNPRCRNTYNVSVVDMTTL